MKKSPIILLALFAISSITALAQDASVNSFGKGIVFSPEDNSYEMKLGVRFQTLYSGLYNMDTEDYNDQLRTRRARLKFQGFVYSPKLKYKLQLGLVKNDLILDAALKYEFAENWEVWFGQEKLPSNREQINSSQKLQFVDRSLVNSNFSLERDIGVHLLNTSSIGNGVINTHVAIASGEGTSPNVGGYSYSGRVEYLPFGNFTNKGAFFGADLEREENPKLMIAAAFGYNDGAMNNFVENDLRTLFLDVFYKYNGFNFASEFAAKTGDDNVVGFGTGTGFVAQAGYLFENNYETAVRFTNIDPDNLSSLTKGQQYTLGLSKYISGHNLKVQTDLSYNDNDLGSNTIMYRFQVEVAF